MEMLKTGKYKYKCQEGGFVKRTYAVLQRIWQSIFSRSTEVSLERISSGIMCTELTVTYVKKKMSLYQS